MKEFLENKLVWSANVGTWAFIAFAALLANEPSAFSVIASAVATTALFGFFARIGLGILDSMPDKSNSQQAQVLETSAPDYIKKSAHNWTDDDWSQAYRESLD